MDRVLEIINNLPEMETVKYESDYVDASMTAFIMKEVK